ncbi:hypothetical protein HDF24_00605 [Mucilaginibacter sp. X4EP1]|uniref:hypothetical protein n=1 Tax=Mucilaginibacter sp. X4EP1 TaxID=2723092 RepID=UPI002168430A|nr:hypothetical protein [Mucilaginibacter sp. X4EP1]MCS3811512.1 glucan phosphoethanolaminetransferase (alkaline phosphatase superfamily) [Mucilaginibacter sp. X4EP1]
MNTRLIPIPKIAIRTIAGGLLLMAFFTIMWSGIASANLPTTGQIADLVIFWGGALAFIGYAIYFFMSAKRFQTVMTETDKAEGKKMGKAYGIIFGLEGMLIPVAVFICLQLGKPELVLPAIALVVGLHFYPMARIFGRTIDYYVATWATLIAISTIILTIKQAVLPVPVLAVLGVGMAIATTIYGINMIRIGLGYLRS